MRKVLMNGLLIMALMTPFHVVLANDSQTFKPPLLSTQILHFGTLPNNILEMQAITEPGSKFVRLIFHNWARFQGHYRPDAELHLIADGQPLNLGKCQHYQVHPDRGVNVVESGFFEIPMDTFKKIASSKVLSGHFQDTPLPFSQKPGFGSFRDLIEKVGSKASQ